MRLRSAVCWALVLVSCAGTAFAQELQGFRTRPDGGFDVAWVDPTNGAVSSLASGGIPAGFTYTGGTGAVDHRGQRLFAAVLRTAESNSRFYSVSLKDGAVLSNPFITGSGTTTSFLALEYDEAEGVAYAIKSPGDGTRRLCKIVVASGAMTDVGTGTATSTSSSGSPGALDAAGNRFFFAGTPNGETDARLLVFNTAATMGTGIIANPVMTGTSTNPVIALAWDPLESVLYGIRSLGGARQLVTVNTTTGAVTPLGAGTGVTVSGGPDSLDHTHNRFFFVGTANGETDPRLYTFDTADGSIDASPVMPTQIMAVVQWREPSLLKGDLNVEGATDLLLRNSANTTEAWLMNGTTRVGLASLVPNPVTDETIAGIDDFDGDGFNDLAIRRTSTGAVEFWLMGEGGSGTNREGPAVPLVGGSSLPPNWKLSVTGDFNRDSWPDLLWRNTTSQKLVVWALTGTTKTGNIVPTPDQAVDANWEVVAGLDFNRDGNRDLLWYNATSGRIVTWNMNHLMVRIDGNFTNPMAAGDNNWRVVAGGDYGLGPDGPDAAAPVLASNDLVWRNATSGKMVVWHMDLHRQRTGGLFTNPDSGHPNPTDWNVVGPR